MLHLGPRVRIKLLWAGSVGLVCFTWIILTDLNQYRQAGSEPREMSMAQVKEAAAASPFVVHWVRLTEPLQFDCSHALAWQEDGKVTSIILAFDASKQQPFWLEYKGQVHSCADLQQIPLEGMLVEPAKFWAKQGMVRPPSRGPLVELKVGSSPAELRTRIETMAPAELLFLAALALWHFSRPRRLALSRNQSSRPVVSASTR